MSKNKVPVKMIYFLLKIAFLNCFLESLFEHRPFKTNRTLSAKDILAFHIARLISYRNSHSMRFQANLPENGWFFFGFLPPFFTRPHLLFIIYLNREQITHFWQAGAGVIINPHLLPSFHLPEGTWFVSSRTQETSQMEHALGKICLSSDGPVFSEGQASPSLLLNLK